MVVVSDSPPASPNSSGADSIQVGTRVGRYRVLSLLGRGGMSSVWKARDELLHRTVALKILADALAADPDARRRFWREAEVASLLDHPAIATIFDAGEDGAWTYIAMALIEGHTLSDRLARSLLPVPEAVRVAQVVAGALGYAHARGVVHRDVTSRNIMIASDGDVFIVDFGLALALGASRWTSPGVVPGTAGFMAPEVLLGGPTEPRSDLFGLGVVFYHALTGALPFRGERREVIDFASLYQTPAPPSALRQGLSPEIDRIVLKALARDPLARYQHADEWIADLQALEARPQAEPAAAGPSTVARALATGAPAYLAVPRFSSEVVSGDPPADLERVAVRLTQVARAGVASAERIHVVPCSESGVGLEAPDALRGLAERAGANLVLRGSVSAAGTRRRVTFSLIDPAGPVQIGGDVLDGSVGDELELESRVVASLRRALGLSDRDWPTTPRSEPRDPAAREHFMQALRYLERHDVEASVDGAIGLLERLAASESGTAAVDAALARAYARKYMLTQQHVWESRAASACQRAMASAPELPEVQLALGDLHHAGRRFDEAMARYRAVLTMRPDLFEARWGEARALSASGRNAEAEDACRRAIRIRPEDWRGYSLLGRIYYERGEYPRAVEPWRKVLQLVPDSALVHRNIGSAMFRLDRLQDAASAYRRSIEIHPNADAYTDLGTVLFFLEHYDEAVETLEKAVRLTPANPVMWGQLGSAHRLIPGHEEQAREALTRAIGLMRDRLAEDAGDPDAWARLAGWHANLGDRTEALAAIGRALAMAPERGDCLAHAGHIHFQLGDRSEALRSFREAVRHGYGAEALRRSPELKPLHQDPDFRRILEESPTKDRPDARKAFDAEGDP